MKICVTSSAPNLDSEMDPRFGRCQYFLFIDPETMAFEAMENPNIGASGGAGIQSAQLVANKGAEALITGQVGPNAFTALQAAGVKILTGASGKVREALDKYKKGQLFSTAQGATVQAHFGAGRRMGHGMEMSLGFPPPPSSPLASPVPQEELIKLKEQSQQLKEQLDRITEKIDKLGINK